MRVYLVHFNTYDGNGCDRKTVSKTSEGGVKEQVKCGDHGDLLLPATDLARFEGFGRGYQSVRFIGDLDDSYFK